MNAKVKIYEENFDAQLEKAPSGIGLYSGRANYISAEAEKELYHKIQAYRWAIRMHLE